jgi:hypothetical protein
MPTLRCRAASAGVAPLMRMLPPVGATRPAIAFSSVLLPQPEGPISAAMAPFGTVRFTCSITLTLAAGPG